MRRKRISGTKVTTRGTTEKRPSASVSSLKFIGVSLAGGKTDKACLAVVEYFPEHKKIFLSKVLEKVKTTEDTSADEKLISFIQDQSTNLVSVGFDVPFQVPLCLRCRLACPGYERCEESHIQWLRNQYREIKQRPTRSFTPYTERSAEVYLAKELEEPFQIHHALGANLAPLTARAYFLRRRLLAKTFEVSVPVSVYRIGRHMRLGKGVVKSTKHFDQGENHRHLFLKSLSESRSFFLYQQDIKMMEENNHAFEAFICGIVGYLRHVNQIEPRPRNFPKEEDWIDFPTTHFNWVP